jgi:hypothetical protein
MAGIEEGRRGGYLVPSRDTQQAAEGNLPIAAFFGQLSETPDGVDPAYWPVQVLNEINHHILNRDHPGNESPGLWGISSREIGERFAPLKEHMQKVTTAYKTHIPHPFGTS